MEAMKNSKREITFLTANSTAVGNQKFLLTIFEASAPTNTSKKVRFQWAIPKAHQKRYPPEMRDMASGFSHSRQKQWIAISNATHCFYF